MTCRSELSECAWDRNVSFVFSMDNRCFDDVVHKFFTANRVRGWLIIRNIMFTDLTANEAVIRTILVSLKIPLNIERHHPGASNGINRFIKSPICHFEFGNSIDISIVFGQQYCEKVARLSVLDCFIFNFIVGRHSAKNIGYTFKNIQLIKFNCMISFNSKVNLAFCVLAHVKCCKLGIDKNNRTRAEVLLNFDTLQCAWTSVHN